MPDCEFKVKFWGVRGSIPVPGDETLKVGGNTSCIEICDDNQIIIIDAGTGFRNFGKAIMNLPVKHINLFFSHYHWDHLQGFSFFAPLRKKDFLIDAYGETKVYGSTEDIVSGQMTHPYFPVTISDLAGTVKFHEIKKEETVKIGDFTVKAIRLRHPDGCLGYKISKNGKSFMYEHLENQEDDHYLEVLKGVDYFMHDSSYTNDELTGVVGPSRRGWGHSTWEKGCQMAKAAGVKNLVLSHHEIDRTDEMVFAIEKEARKLFPNTIAAYEGLIIKV